jgi:hypothetical protein
MALRARLWGRESAESAVVWRDGGDLGREDKDWSLGWLAEASWEDESGRDSAMTMADGEGRERVRDSAGRAYSRISSHRT